ncbi:MAG: hypothetical protein FIA92_18030 [Chloroflexi bacterium]|nr:hypothetical protein [Chloroflexota bacterium]
MRLYLDEDVASKELVNRLSRDHEVLPTLRGEIDRRVWEHAQASAAVVVTMNARDFIGLAASSVGHHGLLVVYRANDPRFDMTIREISDAINRVAAMDTDLVGAVIVLNQYRS